MLAAFFPDYEPEYIEERLFQYHIHNHIDLPLDTDLKRFFFFSRRLEKELRDKEQEDKKQMEQMQQMLGR